MLKSFTLRSLDELWATDGPRSSNPHSGWRQILAGIDRYRRLRRAERELESLDDRMLKDIGIGRSEISSVVRYGRAR